LTGALEALRTLAGPDAEPRPHQLEAIGDLVEDRARVLCVQRTGWGKSAVYFVATALLRNHPTHPAGPTLIVSPLLALMRNQIEAAARLGIRAHTVNSTNRAAWDEVRELLAADAVDLLLISPERLNNPQFRETMLPLFAERVGLLVVDEAHCVSDWGHDFRPDYRRIADVLDRLPAGVAVLGTTATANDRVVRDVEEQLGAVRTYRGPLARRSLRLEVVDLARQADRLAWLATHLPELEGSGIVYTLTKRDADTVADWLNANGVTAEAYSGEVETERRIEVEERLLRNTVKAVVATSALGMGYDKPDLGWVVHYQAPGSVIAYYQQVGRAGRGVEHAEVVLLRGAEDRRIQDFFISTAFPRREHVEAVLDALPATTRQVSSVVNLGTSRIDAMLKVLDVEGAVRRDGTTWHRVDGTDWQYDASRYEAVTELRRAEQAAMARLGSDGRCLMHALQEELDDPEPRDCGRCSVCTAPKWNGPLDPELVRAAALLLRDRPIVLDAKKMAPDAGGAMRKIPEDAQASEGRALARLGDGGWSDVPDDDPAKLDAAAELVRRWGVSVAWVAAVPPRAELGRALAERLGLPFLDVLARTEARPPQSEMANAATQAANVRGAFAVTGDVPASAGLLVDDVRQSGWTLAMVAGQLRRRGAGAVHPLVLASAY
jgi:ATP-dependent DNA helicase RecQ